MPLLAPHTWYLHTAAGPAKPCHQRPCSYLPANQPTVAVPGLPRPPALQYPAAPPCRCHPNSHLMPCLLLLRLTPLLPNPMSSFPCPCSALQDRAVRPDGTVPAAIWATAEVLHSLREQSLLLPATLLYCPCCWFTLLCILSVYYLSTPRLVCPVLNPHPPAPALQDCTVPPGKLFVPAAIWAMAWVLHSYRVTIGGKCHSSYKWGLWKSSLWDSHAAAAAAVQILLLLLLLLLLLAVAVSLLPGAEAALMLLGVMRVLLLGVIGVE